MDTWVRSWRRNEEDEEDEEVCVTPPTSGSGVGGGQRTQVLQQVVHHAHLGLLLTQRNSHSSSCTRQHVSDMGLPPVGGGGCRSVHPPAGLTCLKEAAAATPTALRSSRTSCQAFRASHRLMKPGEPLTTGGRQRMRDEG